MQNDSHARFYQFRQANFFDKPDQNIRDGHGPQVQCGHATAVGPAPAPVQEESVADSVDGDEEENDYTCSIQHYLTHDGHGYHGQHGRQASPVHDTWYWDSIEDELEVDEDEHEDDDEFDTSEGLKKENVNEKEDSVGKSVENETKETSRKRTLILTKILWKMWRNFYNAGEG